ncbi:lysM domain receptor-like kinase 4 [Lolium rigidum]|uniref:lysM domain receptor-like kinase 4 n=1 Tax=Lolium rigidum TaxID=89674 RepID=UPI001F5D99B2|nr:lysM domain receptor-like kinase 4 [Lolium rigidum]
MAPPSRATVALFFYAIGVLLLSCSPPARSQQPYGSQIADCGSKHNDTGLLGYFCGSGAPSCESYLTFHARSPFSDPASIAALLGADAASLAAANSASSPFAQGTKVLIPVRCSCTGAAAGGSYYQRNATYVARDGDTLLIIANNTFQGLSTCQAVEEQSLGGAAPTSLLAGQSVTVPLRCACPSASQAAAGVRFLVSYLVDELDEVDAVAARFGVDAGNILEANQLKSNATIYPYTTLLIPVKSQPNISQLQSPPPPPPPVASVPATKSKSHTGVYIGIGVAVAVVAVIASVVAALVLKARRRRASTGPTTAGGFAYKDGKDMGKLPYGVTGDEVSMTISEAFSSLSDIKSSLKVYTYDELVTATDDFSTERRISGSVYRAAFNEDTAAVEIVDHDVSTEVEITRRMNHFNLVRLNGFCHHRGRWYLVSEYAEHGTLRDRLLAGATGAAAPLNWTQRVQVALDVAEGLRYLHGYARPPYVHMDVRSGSVLLDTAFRAKIRNFGGARVIRGGDDGDQGDVRELFTMTSTIAGARGYMAPEYLEHGVVSPKADVYSFGVVLLELFTGNDVEQLEEDGGGDPLAGLNALGVDRKNDKEYHGDDGAALKRLEEFVDPTMAAGSCPLDAVVMMGRLIERCVQRNAGARPGMGEVAQYLLKLSDISGDSWQSSSEYRQSSVSEATSEHLAR